jgi:DNA-binding response OmpR family regulator
MSAENERQPTIFLVEEDNDTRPILKRNLREQGYPVIVALDEEDALERVEGGRTDYGLLLLNVVGVRPEEALESARRIHRRAGRDSTTPIVVMAEKYGEEMEGKDVAVDENVYVTYLEDGDQLHSFLARLLPPASTSI